MIEDETQSIHNFFFVPKFRRTQKIKFSKELKSSCKGFSSTIANICTKNRNTFIKHISKLDYWESVIESGNEYLKSFFGFVFDPTGDHETQQDINMDGENVYGETTKQKEMTNITNLPISKLRHTMTFSWKPSLCSLNKSKKEEIAFGDSFYEASCVLFNIMIAYMLEVEEILDNKSKVKQCFQKMLSALGIAEFLENCHFNDPVNKDTEIPFDMTKPAIFALKSMIIGHVQEIAILLALQKEGKYAMVAKLAKGASDSFLEGYKKIEANLDGEWKCVELTTWADYLYLKHKMYEVYALIYNGIHQNKTLENNAAAMKCLFEAKRWAKGMKKDLAKFNKNYWRRKTRNKAVEHVEYILESVERWNENFQRENDLVEHASMPEVLPTQVGMMKIGKPNKFILSTPSKFWNEYGSFLPKNQLNTENPDGIKTGKNKKVNNDETDDDATGVYNRQSGKVKGGDEECSIL